MIVIKFRAFDDGKMIYSHNNMENDDFYQLSWFFKAIREDAIIMQFTGLLDKNGVEIYEHDKLDNEEVVTCSIEQGCYFAGHSPLCMSASHREVIGNIHELTT
jgi:hypothetical protein